MYEMSKTDSRNILELIQGFRDVDGVPSFTHTLLVFQQESDDNIYHASSKSRYATASDVHWKDVSDITPIPISSYQPAFSSSFTRGPCEPSPDVHIKKPRLIGYDGTDGIAKTMLAEVRACEAIRDRPHPNLATYLGCQVTNKTISGICYAKYDSTLMELANPGHRGKRHALLERKPDLVYTEKFYQSLLDGVERGLRHLHTMGLVHNDLNPSNIMVHKKGEAVVIDFGSCRPEGADLRGVGQTYEWFDMAVQVSQASNDLDALEEIRTWLGMGSGIFKFSE